MRKKSAVLIGATGLIGKELAKVLFQQNNYEKIHLLVRRSSGLHDPKCEEHIADFDRLDQHSHLFHGSDVFCCLGTTMKQAKTKEAFRKVDYVYPVEAGKLAEQFHSEQYLIVTALGSNPDSAIFYNRVKGEVEESIKKLRLPALHIFRPSLLLGERQQFRLGEKLMIKAARVLNLFMVGKLRPYRAIEAKKVALAMAAIAKSNKSGAHVYPSDEIDRIAAES
ncbi:NAD-dependent epimerase/dehydratase family protein [Paenibacillus beijingensis]|uniref:Oxidoreductase n=1 Tax=Paenibacillus beijingensis TaxID=1126833 RepID=A0A0D5NP15_9BACL|nr:NAD-dependent epimerase/dehydratase family protein [Paenibacillus beijingensis]AJY76742.1 oxidoreductase [Paenibacillus beijingensis]